MKTKMDSKMRQKMVGKMVGINTLNSNVHGLAWLKCQGPGLRPGLTWLRLGDIVSWALGLCSGSAQAWLRLRPWLGKAGAQVAQATAAVA